MNGQGSIAGREAPDTSEQKPADNKLNHASNQQHGHSLMKSNAAVSQKSRPMECAGRVPPNGRERQRFGARLESEGPQAGLYVTRACGPQGILT